jgi:hypothetical protein
MSDQLREFAFALAGQIGNAWLEYGDAVEAGDLAAFATLDELCGDILTEAKAGAMVNLGG